MTTYDVVVIGGGSGGSAFARRAASYGAKVVIVEKGPTRDADGLRTGAGFGGTCVNVGCVPKKLMYEAASEREGLMSGFVSGFGIAVGAASGGVDWPDLKSRRDAYVAQLNKNYEANWTKAGIDVVLGEASFIGPLTVRVTPSNPADPKGVVRELTGRRVLIAVGGVPSPLPVPGGELAIDSDGFFDLATQPRKVAVVGAGYIAVELAGVLHGLGSETHLFFRGPTVLRTGFDPYIIETLMEELEQHGPTLHANASPKSLARADDGTLTLTVQSASGGVEQHGGFDVVLSAIGRRPLTEVLNLSAAGVAIDRKGLITVDAYENTSAPNVHALGDVTTSGWELTPVAIAAGRRLADRLFGGERRARIEYACIPTVVFSHPPIGCVGLTEPQARATYGDAAISTKQARFSSMRYALSPPHAKVKTAIKLVLRGAEERVVGLHMIGPRSDEMLQGFAIAVRMGATRADFEATIAIHPTIAEELVTFGGWGQQKSGSDGALRPQLPPYLRERPRTRMVARVAACVASAVASAAALTWMRRNR